jgi:hypothetical protein
VSVGVWRKEELREGRGQRGRAAIKGEAQRARGPRRGLERDHFNAFLGVLCENLGILLASPKRGGRRINVEG